IIILYLILGPLILSSFPTRRSSDLFNFATQYTDKFHFGLNLNAHFVNYERSNAFFENNDNPVFPDGETTREIWYQNDLYTYGSGFSLQLGAIAKITNRSEERRVGKD